MRPSRLIVFGAALAVLALAVAPMATPARAESIGQEKIDPALRDLMSSRPFALLPVIVEMQNPLPPFSGAPNVNRAREALDLLGLNGTQVAALSLINGAAGFANAAGITAMSLVPAVAAIHHDATIVAADALPNAASALSLDPLPTPPPLLPPPATPTPLPIATATPTPTPAPTAAPSPTLAPTPAPTTAPSASPPLPPDPTPTPAPSGPPIQSGTPPPSPSPTATPVPSAPPTPTASATPWPTPAPSDAPPPTQSGTPPPSPSPSVTPTPTAPPTPTASATPSPTAGPAAQAPPFSAVYPRAVRANEVWTKQTTGKGVTVAVLDSGVAADPDLVEPANRILASVNFADQRPVSDPGGHGTHVAGIIAGNGTRSGGQFVGIAPQANIVDVRVLGRTGSGRISSVVRGIEWVIAHRFTYNIRVINLSFGAPARTSYRADPLAAAVEIAWRRGLVVVAAAGNGGPGRDTVASPGIDPYVITVGATDDRGTAGTSDDTLAFFSAWGSPDSNPKPDLVAPGRRIVSIRVAGSALDRLFPDRVVLATNGSTYFRLSGTSMATPVVSGAVALLLEYRPKLTPDQVKALLVATTQPYGQASGVIPPDPKAGGSGMLDAAALQPGAAPPPGGVPPVNLALRPSNGFARGLFPVLYGGALRWKDPTLGGIAWSLLSWDSVSWNSVAWDSVAWDSVAWDSVAWDSVAWDAFTLD